MHSVAPRYLILNQSKMETNHYVYKRVQNCVYLSQGHKKEILYLLRDPCWNYIYYEKDDLILSRYNADNNTEHVHLVSIPMSYYFNHKFKFDMTYKEDWGSNTKDRYVAHCATIKAFKKEERKMKPKTRIEEIANWGVIISIVAFVTYLIYQAF